MFCENENKCQKCNYGFSLFNEQCLPSNNFQNNLKYFTNDNEINYYSCSSMMSDCEECTYDDYSFNKFHCSKCIKGQKLNENYECSGTPVEDSTETDDFEIYKNYSGQFVNFYFSLSLILLLIIFL